MSQKRHQACIDLSTNTLRIQGRDIPFLSEHELPDKARQREEASAAEDLADASGSGSGGNSKRKFPGEGSTLGASPAAPGRPAPAASSSAPAPSAFPETDIATVSHAWLALTLANPQLVGLGASREHAIQLLEAAGGNVESAASFLF